MKHSRPKIAYLMSRFPVLTETFILYEMLELKKRGWDPLVFPLRLEKTDRQHPETQHFKDQIYPAPLLSLKTLWVNLKWLFQHPGTYVSTLFRAAAGTVGSLKLFSGSILYYPKAVVFADLAKRQGVSHVHAHFCTHPAMAAWVMHRLCGISYSFTAHGSDLHVNQQMLVEKTRDAAFAVTISDYNVQFIQERCGADTAQKFEVIHCGTDTTQFCFHAERADGEGALEILCIASLRPVKGHRVLIDACAELKKRGVEFCCRLIGAGPEDGAIRKQIAALDLQNSVLLEGEKARPDVLESLKRADIIALTSIQTSRGSREGIPVALMEGMACGLPVVASRISGIPELVEDGVSGLLFTPGDAIGAADALAQMTPPRRREMGVQARARVKERFDLKKSAEMLIARIEQEQGRPLSVS